MPLGLASGTRTPTMYFSSAMPSNAPGVSIQRRKAPARDGGLAALGGGMFMRSSPAEFSPARGPARTYSVSSHASSARVSRMSPI